jgi:hypothetical protein
MPRAVATWVLPVPRPPINTYILCAIHELATVHCSDCGLVDLAGREVDAYKVVAGWEAGRLHETCDGPNLTCGQFCLQQLQHYQDGGFNSRCPLLAQVGCGSGHALHFEAAQLDNDGAGIGIMTHGGLGQCGRCNGFGSKMPGTRRMRPSPRVGT